MVKLYIIHIKRKTNLFMLDGVDNSGTSDPCQSSRQYMSVYISIKV